MNSPQARGGISKFMASVCSNLGREEICCLTGMQLINRRENAKGLRVYRRPSPFAKAWHVQAPSLAITTLQILLREPPDVIQIAQHMTVYRALVTATVQNSLCPVCPRKRNSRSGKFELEKAPAKPPRSLSGAGGQPIHGGGGGKAGREPRKNPDPTPWV